MELLEDGLALCVSDLPSATLQAAAGLLFTAALAWAHLALLGAPDAVDQAVPVALGLALVHAGWLWQRVRFGQVLCRRLGSTGQAPRGWGQLRNQLAWQPWALLVLPCAAATVVGLAPALAFFQALATVDDGRQGPGALGRRAWDLAQRAPFQLQRAQALLLGVGLVLFINVMASAFIGAQLAKQLLGLNSALSLYPAGALNGTFFILSLGTAWALLSPLSLAVQALRWSEAEAGPRGEDLALRLAALDAPAGGPA